MRNRNFGLLFLLVPAASFYLAISQGLRMPFNEARFLPEALLICLLSYAVVWFLSFSKSILEKDMVMVSIVCLILWILSGIPGIAAVNRTFDTGAPSKKIAKILAVRELSGGSTRGSCLLTLSDEIEGLNLKSIRRTYCQVIRPGIDGIEFTFRPGALGWAWAEDYSVIQDYDLYRQRLEL